MSRPSVPICDTIGCFDNAVVFHKAELRQGMGEIRLCRACAEHAVRLLVAELKQAERQLVGAGQR
jgi:hypothetical protein